MGEMPTELAEVLNAFGASQYAQCRVRAKKVIAESNDSSVQVECVGLIILSRLHEGNFEAARTTANELGSISPFTTRELLARVNREEREYNAEVNHLQHIVVSNRVSSEAARAQLWTAHEHQRAGRLDLAQRSYRKVMERYPTSPDAGRAVTQLAAIAIRRGDLDTAETLYRDATELNPKILPRAEAMTRIAGIEAHRGRPDIAEQAWWEVINDYPNSPQASDAVVGITALHRRIGDTNGAFGVCEKVIDLAPDTVVAVTASEQILAMVAVGPRPDYTAAAQRLSRIVAAHPGTAAARYAKKKVAWIHLRNGLREWKADSYLEAIPELEKALEQEALGIYATTVALRTIGQCYDATEQVQKAIPYFELALELASGEKKQFEIGWALGICHYNLQNYQQGYKLFKFVAALSMPDNLKEIASDKAAECVMQAEAAGRPFDY